MANNTTRLHRPPYLQHVGDIPIIDMDNLGHVRDSELTPELKSRVLDIELKTEEKKIDNEIENEWNCCMTTKKTDSRLIKYLFQMMIIIAIISICLAKLAQQNLPCEQANVYVGLISLLIGIVLPSPSSSKK